MNIYRQAFGRCCDEVRFRLSCHATPHNGLVFCSACLYAYSKERVCTVSRMRFASAGLSRQKFAVTRINYAIANFFLIMTSKALSLVYKDITLCFAIKVGTLKWLSLNCHCEERFFNLIILIYKKIATWQSRGSVQFCSQ